MKHMVKTKKFRCSLLVRCWFVCPFPLWAQLADSAKVDAKSEPLNLIFQKNDVADIS